MSLDFAAKQTIVKEVTEVAKASSLAVAAEYRGLNVSAMTDLRRSARGAGIYLRVIRNTLARRALQDTDFSCMCAGLTGQLVFVFAGNDPHVAAKVVNDFTKRNNELVVKLVVLEGKLLDPSEVETLANLPSKDEAIGMLMGIMKMPVVALARALSAPQIKLARTLKAVADQK